MLRRARVGARWLLALAPLLAACGGIVERRGDASESVDDSTSNDSASGDSNPSSNVKGDTALGDCALGPAESRGIPCAWVADRRCYTDREMACNCACPRTRDSQCVSGFDDGPNGHVAVSCD